MIECRRSEERRALDYLETQRDRAFQERRGELEPNGVLKKSNALAYALERLPPSEAVCLTAPSVQPVTFLTLLLLCIQYLTECMTADRKRLRNPEEPSGQLVGIAPVVEFALQIRRTIDDILSSNGIAPETARSIRKLLFGNRTVDASRAGLSSEFGLLISAYERLTEKPDALVGFMPRVHEAYRKLQEVNPAPAGRRPIEPLSFWGPETVQATWLNHTLQGLILSWVIGVGSESTVATVRRIVLPRRPTDRTVEGGEETGEAAATDAAKDTSAEESRDKAEAPAAAAPATEASAQPAGEPAQAAQAASSGEQGPAGASVIEKDRITEIVAPGEQPPVVARPAEGEKPQAEG